MKKSIAYSLIKECIKNKSEILDLGNCDLNENSPEIELLIECTHIKVLNLGVWYFMNEKFKSSINSGPINQFKSIPSKINLLHSLEIISFTKNKINKIDNLSYLINLQVLDLYYNKIRIIENLDSLVNLTYLNLGHNNIHKIENLTQLVNLKNLEVGGSVENINNLEHLAKLSKLSLTGCIPKIENLDKLLNLNDLTLFSNGWIKKIENLGHLVKLSKLTIYGNIHKIENLENLIELKFLDLNCNNNINKIENLDSLVNLEEIDFGSNAIRKIENLAFQKKLIILNLSNNRIIDIDNLVSIELKILKLKGNDVTEIKNISSLLKLEMIEFSIHNIGVQSLVEMLRYLISIDFTFYQIWQEPQDSFYKSNINLTCCKKQYLISNHIVDTEFKILDSELKIKSFLETNPLLISSNYNRSFISDEDVNEDELEDDNDETELNYSKHGGAYGYDDDTIDSAFDGDPENYWNID